MTFRAHDFSEVLQSSSNRPHRLLPSPQHRPSSQFAEGPGQECEGPAALLIRMASVTWAALVGEPRTLQGTELGLLHLGPHREAPPPPCAPVVCSSMWEGDHHVSSHIPARPRLRLWLGASRSGHELDGEGAVRKGPFEEVL